MHYSIGYEGLQVFWRRKAGKMHLAKPPESRYNKKDPGNKMKEREMIMYCKNCGAAVEDEAMVCANCGTQVREPAAVPQQKVVYAAPIVTNEIPEENRPLSPWAYAGLQILFAIPIVGFIFLIVFSCSGANINRRNFARSYWCFLLIVAIVCAIAFMAGFMGEMLR